MLRTLRRLTFGVVLTGALLAVGYPAAAAPASGQVAAAASTDTNLYIAPSGSNNVACFGYTGTLKAGSVFALIDWTSNGSWDECFGIAPDRTIWHAWPNSGGWKRMPNNGYADNITYGFLTSAGKHTIKVRVTSQNAYYCSTLTTSWQRWQNC